MPVTPYDPKDYERGTPVDFDYPEGIPEDFKGRPVVWRRSVHVCGLFKPHYAWNIDLIPAKYRERLCYGIIPTNIDGHASYERIRGHIVCGECELTKVYNSHWCLGCGNFFIRDFNDTRFCVAYPHCWSCLGQLSWDYCPDHSLPNHVKVVEEGKGTTLVYPQGFNPKDYSDQEMKDFLDEIGI
jgi:hypothetical protein